MPSTPGDIGTESMHHCQVCRADEPIYSHNDLAATLIDAADVVAELLSQGHHVLLHCVHAHHRTPSVALVYAVKYRWLTTDAAAEQIGPRALGLAAHAVDDLLRDRAGLDQLVGGR